MLILFLRGKYKLKATMKAYAMLTILVKIEKSDNTIYRQKIQSNGHALHGWWDIIVTNTLQDSLALSARVEDTHTL